jgi:hypothetical protein
MERARSVRSPAERTDAARLGDAAGAPVQVIGRDDLIRNKRALDRPQDRLDVRRLERGGEDRAAVRST